MIPVYKPSKLDYYDLSCFFSRIKEMEREHQDMANTKSQMRPQNLSVYTIYIAF